MGDRANPLSRFELELMHVFWGLGRASIREIHERLSEARRPAYTTVQTIVNRLEEKGALRRVRKIGNAHVFEPAISRQAVRRRLLDDFLGLFGGTPQHLMAHLVETGRLSLADLRELERIGGEPLLAAPAEQPARARRRPHGQGAKKR